MIPAGFVQELLSRVDIVDVVGRHVELKRGGTNFMGLCPFHTEKSPSFSVAPGKQFYYCFGCGASGDAIRFLTEHLGLSFVESVRELAQGVGLAVPEEQVSPEERQRRDTLRQRRLSLSGILDKAAAFYRTELRGHPQAIDYLKLRGLSGTVAARFGLGFAPPGWRSLARAFASYDDPLLEEAGLVRLREADHDAGAEPPDRGRYDWFRNRIIFPIRGVDGQVIGFGGRVLDDAKPKYINSPETPLFSKGRELYGLFEARQALRDKGCALVVEGYMDVVALAQAGFANAVATLGTACTAEHVHKLFRFTDSMVFAFDGDAAGRRAAARALEAALPHASDTRTVRFLFLPPEHDPDSFVRELGAEAFESALRGAVPLSRQLVEQAARDLDLATAEGRSHFLSEARPLWDALPPGALRRQVLPEIARRAQFEPAELSALWGESPSQGTGTSRQPAPRPHFGGGAALPGRGFGRAGRRAPAAPADLAIRLLMRHSDWWDRLDAEDQGLLHDLGGVHGGAVAWLERQLIELGPLTWSALDEAMADQPWAAQARSWIGGADPDEVQDFADLRRVMHLLWKDRLQQQAEQLAAAAPTDRADLDRLRALHEQIRRINAELATASA